MVFLVVLVENFRSNGTSEKEVLYFRTEYFERKFVYQLLKPIFDASVRLPQAF